MNHPPRLQRRLLELGEALQPPLEALEALGIALELGVIGHEERAAVLVGLDADRVGPEFLGQGDGLGLVTASLARSTGVLVTASLACSFGKVWQTSGATAGKVCLSFGCNATDRSPATLGNSMNACQTIVPTPMLRDIAFKCEAATRRRHFSRSAADAMG